jgi:MFS family permease
MSPGGRIPSPLLAVLCGIVFADLLLWLAVLPLLPHWERAFSIGPEGTGLVLGAYSAGLLVASVPAGYLADRAGTKRVTVAATVALAATGPLLAFADTTWELVAARALQGLAASVSWSAGLAWLLTATPPNRRTRALATINGSAIAATLVGPLAGGPLVAAVGFRPAMRGFAGVLGVLAVAAAAMPRGKARCLGGAAADAYAVRVVIDGRARLRVAAATRAEARDERERLNAAARRGELPVFPRLTFAEAAARWLQHFEASRSRPIRSPT